MVFVLPFSGHLFVNLSGSLVRGLETLVEGKFFDLKSLLPISLLGTVTYWYVACHVAFPN